MKTKYCVFILCLFIGACKIFPNKSISHCDCVFSIETITGIYEEFYIKPLEDSRFWLEKVILTSKDSVYGLGVISSSDIEDCSNLKKVLKKDTLRFFYGNDFYPKQITSEVSNTTNLFYNSDSSRIIIAFNIVAKVVRLNENVGKREICMKMLKKRYYNYAYDMNGVIENELLGFVNARFTGSLSKSYQYHKKYSFARDVKPFSYWTGH